MTDKPTPSATVEVGQVIGGDYEILQPISAGGMGAVFVALDRPLRRKVAIKAMLTSLLEVDPEQFRARFEQEAVLTGACNHPAVVTVYRFGQEADVLWYAMEYLEGAKSLSHCIARSMKEGAHIPLAHIAAWLSDAAQGLAEIHKVSIHRDIKPANLLTHIDHDHAPHLKVLDLGVAFLAQSELTATGMMPGTQDYWAPEIYHEIYQPTPAPSGSRGAAKLIPTPAHDFFALGLSFYRALTLRDPFGNTTDTAARVQSLLHSIPPPPTSVRPDLPPWVDTVIMGLLEKDPAQRLDARGVREVLSSLETATPWVAPEDQEPITAPARPLAVVQGGLELPSISAAASLGFHSQPPRVAGDPNTAQDELSQSSLLSSAEEQLPSLEGDAAEYAAIPRPGEGKSRFAVLPARLKAALIGAAALVVVLLIVIAITAHESSPTKATPAIDPTGPQPEVRPVTANDILHDQKKARTDLIVQREHYVSASTAVVSASPKEEPRPPKAKSPKRRNAAPARKEVTPPPQPQLPPKSEPEVFVKDASTGFIVLETPSPSSTGEAAQSKTPKKIPRLGIPTTTTVAAHLVTPISTDTKSRDVLAELSVPLTLSDKGVVLPKGTRLVGRFTASLLRDKTGQIEITFHRLVLPNGTEGTFAGIAVTKSGRVGLVGRVKRHDSRSAANVRDGVLDVAEELLGDAPGSRTVKRFTSDERRDTAKLRRESTTISLPKSYPFVLRFTQPR